MRRPPQFGVNVDPTSSALATAERICSMAEGSDVDLIGVQDHPYNPEFYDTFTVVTRLLSQTKRVRIFPNVANLPLRPPAMLAKQVATMDAMSGGRFELGLGAGAFWDGIAGMGGLRRTTGEAREALSEAIDILRATWKGESFRYQGRFYEASGVNPGAPPPHQIGIWLGVVGPKALALLGAKADGWSVSAPYVPPPKLADLHAIINDAAKRAGRDPNTIVRLYNVMGTIADRDRDNFHGPVARWTETLTELYLEFGMDTFVFWPSQDREQQSRLFAEQVIPAVREAIAGRTG